jgi:hypothetical protein
MSGQRVPIIYFLMVHWQLLWKARDDGDQSAHLNTVTNHETLRTKYQLPTMLRTMSQHIKIDLNMAIL